jgi:hypothetical protein
MTAGGGCVNETRLFKVGNELTNLPRHTRYYDTINVTVKFEFLPKCQTAFGIKDPLDLTGIRQESSLFTVTR